MKKKLNKDISKEFGSKLIPEEPKPSNLYLLPKIHKKFSKIPKGRPIIAGCGSNTERISWLLDNIGKHLVQNLESYIEIEDTPILLRKFEEINETKLFLQEPSQTQLMSKVFILTSCSQRVLMHSKKFLMKGRINPFLVNTWLNLGY